MSRRSSASHGWRVPTPTITGLRFRDEIGMPVNGQPVVARARKDERYDVHVVRDEDAMRSCLGGLLDGVATVALITDTTVEALHGAALLRTLRAQGVDVVARAVPAGERTKSLGTAVRLWNWLAQTGLGRRDVVATFGGGVINDLGGWVASAYMRGVPYVNLPTTLMAMVDGALGGKVAVNHPVAKNLLGAFQQPAGVISDVRFLRTLDRRHLAAGIAECVKKGVIASPEYFAFVEDHAGALLGGDLGALERLVSAAAAIKTALIERDPYEEDLRRPLNFGHTVGHPLETVTGYGPLLHGEAVAFGMAVEARVAAARGWLSDSVLDRLLSVLRRCRLPVSAEEHPVTVRPDALVAATEKVRLIRAGSLRWVLPLDLGDTAIVDDVSEMELRTALAACGMC
jgi:3-dehydroquinate synthase